jgi:hypothetical protein
MIVGHHKIKLINGRHKNKTPTISLKKIPNFLGVRPSQQTAVEIYAIIWTLNFFEKSQTKYETSCFSESFSQKLFNFCHALINVNLGRSATN